MMPSKWKATALLVAVFLGGVLGGGALALGLTHREPHGLGSGHHRGSEGFARDLTDSLHLTPAQQDSLQAIFARHRAETDSIWHEVGPRFETLRTAIRSEIRSQLTPDQQSQFTEFLSRIDAERRQMEH